MENQSELVKIESNEIASISIFSNKELFEHSQRVANMLSQSDLVPKEYKGNIGNCVIALEISGRIKASPLMVMQNLYIVHGKPSWSSTFLIASLNSCGKFSPIRYEEDEQNGGRTRAWAYDIKSNEKLYGEWVSMEMANAEGWVSKNGSKWKTMPGLMRRYRAASFFVKQFAPEISMGFQTFEEAIDITPYEEVKDTPQMIAEKKERKRIIDHIGKSNTPDMLNQVKDHIGDDLELIALFDQKMDKLQNK